MEKRSSNIEEEEVTGFVAGDSAVRLISFEYSIEQAYVIEFGNEYARFYKEE